MHLQKSCKTGQGPRKAYTTAPDSWSLLAVSRQLRSLSQALDNALNALNEPGTPRKQHVFNMLLVRAQDIYGYHQDERVFAKVIM